MKSKEAEVENSENPFDFVGAINAQLYADYYHLTSRDSSLSSVIMDVVTLAHSNASFQGLSTSPYSFKSLEQLHYILSSPSDSLLTESVQAAVSDPQLQGEFISFIEGILAGANERSSISLYDEITIFEDEVSNNPSIQSDDKRVLLATTSVLRFQLSKKKRRPKKNTDPDWDLMLTTMGATVIGAKDGVQDAIILSLISEISTSN